MTQTKLQIIGTYTPEHEGPYAIDTPRSAQVLYEKIDVHCVVDGIAFVTSEYVDGPWCTKIENIMNAREVPVAREFWVNEFKRGDGHIGVSHAHETELQAINERHERENWNWTRTIHVREVLPGEGA